MSSIWWHLFLLSLLANLSKSIRKEDREPLVLMHKDTWTAKCVVLLEEGATASDSLPSFSTRSRCPHLHFFHMTPPYEESAKHLVTQWELLTETSSHKHSEALCKLQSWRAQSRPPKHWHGVSRCLASKQVPYKYSLDAAALWMWTPARMQSLVRYLPQRRKETRFIAVAHSIRVEANAE